MREAEFSFRPVSRQDCALIFGWLERPHIREWWGEPYEEWALIEEMLETGEAHPFLVESEEGPLAYIQYWEVKGARGKVDLAEAIWLETLPDDGVGVDITIADAKNLGRGLGRAMIGEFIQMLQGKGFADFYIDPDIRNARAIRAYQAAGFQRIGQYPELGESGWAGTLLMRYTPRGRAD